MKSMKVAFVLLAVLGLIKSYTIPNFDGFILCGSSNPESNSDCFSGDLSTGFTCCYVYNIPGQNNTCALVADKGRSLVEAPTYQGNGTFDCGAALNGSYIKYSVSLLAILFYLVL